MQAPKNGFFYVIDAATGKLISAKNFTDITWATQRGPEDRSPGARPRKRATK